MIKREIYLSKLRLARDANVIKVISGVRRSGKSTLLEMFRDELSQSGVVSEQIQFINFENPSYGGLSYQEIYYDIERDLQKNQKNYIFLDEVQNILEFEKLVDGLFINRNIDLYITGSNAYFLSGELATLLSGRYIEIKILPLSFAEYVSAFPSTTDRQRLFNDYMYLGSFPEVVNLINNGQLDLVDDYLLGIYNTVISKDVMTRTGSSDVLILQDIAKYLIDNISRFTNTKKITDALRGGTRPSAYNTVDKYLTALRGSLIFYPVDRYDIKGKKFLQTQQKYYLVDTGLRHTILGASRGDDRGHILENIVYLELVRRENQVWIGKKDDKEIDFVTKSKSGDVAYYQVAYTTKSPEIYDREIVPLRTLADHHPKYIITTDLETLNDHGIKQVNVVNWLLGE
jgi:predicted AAA+ superfamily ATPase